MALTTLTKPRARWSTFKLKIAQAVSRSLYDKLTESGMSVKDFGVQEGQAEDQTDKFNLAFLTCRNMKITCNVPDGVYRVDDTVTMESGGVVIFSAKAELHRYNAHSDKTTPVFILRGNFTQSTGGRFITENDSPNGIITLGHKDISDPSNALWWKCMHPFVEGVKKLGNIGIHIPSAQTYIGSSTANYFGYLENPIIRNCDEGIVLAEVANAHTIIAPQFFRCMTAALSFYGAYGNTIMGGFVHTGDNGIIGINMRNRRTSKDHHSQANFITGLNIEPGGDRSRSLYMDTECRDNYIRGVGNVAGGATILNKDNNIDLQYVTSISRRNYTGFTLTAEDFVLGNERHFYNYKEGLHEDEEVEMFELNPSSRHGSLVEVHINSRTASLDRSGGCRYLVSVQRQSGQPAEFEVLETSESTRRGATLVAKQEGGNVKLYAKMFNNGTSTRLFKCSMKIKVTDLEISGRSVTVTKLS